MHIFFSFKDEENLQYRQILICNKCKKINTASKQNLNFARLFKIFRD